MPKDLKQTDSASDDCAPATCSTARTLATELAKQIEQQDENCEYPHVPTERLEDLLEKFFKEHRLAR
jgi:hypothetical protein